MTSSTRNFTLLCWLSLAALSSLSAQNFNEVIKAVASDREAGDHFGYSVSISGDYAIVGAYLEGHATGGGSLLNGAGAAYIFERDGSGNWSEVQKLVASDREAGDFFGYSVSISGDYAIVGAYAEDHDAGGGATINDAGAAYIYERDASGNWSEVQKLVASDRGAYDQFGYSVSISGDYAIVGARYESNYTGSSFPYLFRAAGAAYIFERDGSGNWSEVQKLVASDRGADDRFGRSVSISGDYAIVGTYRGSLDAGGGNYLDRAGSAYIFERDGSGNWSEAQKLVASDRGAYDQFGYSVSISGDYAIVGAYLEDHDAGGGNPLGNAGAAYIFERDASGNWSEVQKLVASDRWASDLFGYSVSINGDYAIVGAMHEDHDAGGGGTLNDAGAAYIFERDGSGNWSEVQKLVASDRWASDLFGISVAISGDYAMVGAHLEDDDASGGNELDNAGAAYFFEISCFDLNSVTSTGESCPGAGDGQITIAATCTACTGTLEYAIDGVSYQSSPVFTNLTPGLYTVTARDAGNVNCKISRATAVAEGQDFQEILKAVASDREAEDRFGSSVSISGDYAIVGARFEDHDAGSGNSLNAAGAAYIFERDASGHWSEVQKLVASDREAEDRFGISVSISGDYAIVGAWLEDHDAGGGGTLSSAGSAYIFERDASGNWSEMQKLVASDRGAGDLFGHSVSISGDYAIVGARFEDHDAGGGNSLNDAGAAYIFERDGSGNWSEVQKLVASDRGADDRFGYSVAISGDYAIVGASYEDHDAGGGTYLDRAGSAYIFERDGSGNWSEVQKLVASDRGADDDFGYSVSISGDYAIVGAYTKEHDAGGGNSLNAAGAAYIFERDASGNWIEVQKLVASDRGAVDLFGWSVSISGDYAIVGALWEDHDAGGGARLNDAGAAYIFERDGSGNWSEVQKLVASDRGADDYFGYSVSISGDTYIVGAWLEDEDASGSNTLNRAGSAYIFESSSSCDLAISSATPTAETCPGGADGTITMETTCTDCTGSLLYSIDGMNFQADHVFTGLPPGGYTITVQDTDDDCCSATETVIVAEGQNNVTEIIKAVASDRTAADEFGHAVSISGNYAIVGAYQEEEDAAGGATLAGAGAAYIYERDASGHWSEVQKLVASDRDEADLFGSSVAISGNYAIVGAYQEDEDAIGGATIGETGSVYVFERDGSGSWNQVQKLVASDRAANDLFGYALALSGDYAIVGAFAEDQNVGGGATASDAGSAYIFERDASGTWSQVQKVVASDRAAGDRFGISVSLGGDYAIVGAHREDQNAGGGATASDAGSAYIFERDGSGTWSQVQKVVASDRAAGDRFGISVSLNGDYAIVGAHFEDQDATGGATMDRPGSAYVFARDGSGTWSQVQKLVASDRGANDRFGWSVALDGDFAIIGAFLEDEDAAGGATQASAGAAYVFERDAGGNWSELQKLVASDRTADDRLGFSVSVSGDYFIVGAPLEDEDAGGDNTFNSAGSAYILSLPVCCDLAITAATPTNETCPGENDGQIEVMATCSNCTGALQYSLSGAATVGPQAGNTFTGLAPGTYTVLVEDSNNTACNAMEMDVVVGAGMDTEAPVLTCPTTVVSIVLNLCNEITISPVDIPGLSATDICDADVTLSLSETMFDETDIGNQTITVTATDDAGFMSTCMVTLDIQQNPDYFKITPGDDTYATCAADPVAITEADLLANDVITNGDVLRVEDVSLTDPADGTLTGTGPWEFTPAAGFTGDVDLTYVVASTSDPVYFAENGHYYEYVATGQIPWATAKAAAEGMTLYGMQGYLVTVTSQAEQDFVFSKLEGQGWMGASDLAVEGEWRWVTGPEAGQQFWQGTANGFAVNGAYTNWEPGEPNNNGGGPEHYGQFRISGLWNDYRTDNPLINGFVVEYGDNTSCVPDNMKMGNITITVNPTPDIAPIATQMNTCPMADFDLTTVTIVDNNNAASMTRTFHSAMPASATDMSNQLLGAGLTITADATVFVMVANTTTGCYDVTSFMVDIVDCCDLTITSAVPTDEVCPDANDGTITVGATCTTCTDILYSITHTGTSVTTGPQTGNVFMDLSDGTYTVTVEDSGDGSCNAEHLNVTVGEGTDMTPPTFTCPADRMITTDAMCMFEVPDLVAEVIDAMDICPGMPSITQDPVAGTILNANLTGPVTVEITVTDAAGNPTTCDVVLMIPPSCEFPFTITNSFNGTDPCSCNNDQGINNQAGDGTFSELVTVTGDAGLQLRVTQATGMLNTTLPAMLTESAAGVYTIPFNHQDREGYAITEVEFSTDGGTTWNVATGADGFTPLTISNVCAYPVLAFDPALDNSYCQSAAAVTLGAAFNTGIVNPDPLFTPAVGTTTFTVNGSPAASFAPSTLSGTVTVQGMYTPDNGSGVSGTAADPAIGLNAGSCPAILEQIIEILRVDCGTFPWDGN